MVLFFKIIKRNINMIEFSQSFDPLKNPLGYLFIYLVNLSLKVYIMPHIFVKKNLFIFLQCRTFIK